jgi:uncharacterized membrane protein
VAGIGFELREMLRRQSFGAVLRAYGYGGLVSSGPWVLSILSVMGIGILALGIVSEAAIRTFLVSVTYLMACSLITSGCLQFMFTRFVADRLFERRPEAIGDNILGALTLTLLVTGSLASVLVFAFFAGSLAYKVLMIAGFVLLCESWIVVVLLSGLKRYRAVLVAFVAGLAVSAIGAIAALPYGTEGLLAGYLVGQSVLFFSLLSLVLHNFPPRGRVAFDFLDRRKAFYGLLATGLLYNAGIWADKFVFWFNPATSESVSFPLRSSLLYDTPIFLAYLSIVPGMAVFFVRAETDFAEAYEAFYQCVRVGGTLHHIRRLKEEMIQAVRQGIHEIFDVQGLTILIMILAGPHLLRLLKMPQLYLNLFYVHLVGTGAQVLLLAVLNVLFYLDKRREVMFLTGLFATLNLALSLLSQRLGGHFYGLGFAVASLLAAVVGLAIASRKLDHLEYETFMVRR